MSEILVTTKIKEIRVNINNYCRIKLTENGVAIFINYYVKYGMTRTPVLDSEGYLREQLWCVMKIFGDYSDWGGSDSPFESEIIIEGD
jgi:hypothetical protein